MTHAAPCVFCAEPSRITLIRIADNKAVPACRQCVPRKIRLSWAANPTTDAPEDSEHLNGAQKSRVNQ